MLHKGFNSQTLISKTTDSCFFGFLPSLQNLGQFFNCASTTFPISQLLLTVCVTVM